MSGSPSAVSVRSLWPGRWCLAALYRQVAYLAGEFVGSAHAFLQGDVFLFGDQELGVVASELEVFHYGSGNLTVVLLLAEASVGRAFTGGVVPVTVPVNLEEDRRLVPCHAQIVFLHQSFDGVEADV